MKFLPILAILLGMIVSQAYTYAFLIKYLLMLMLFFPFLKISTKTFHPHALWIVVANIVIANTVYLVVLPFNSDIQGRDRRRCRERIRQRRSSEGQVRRLTSA